MSVTCAALEALARRLTLRATLASTIASSVSLAQSPKALSKSRFSPTDYLIIVTTLQ